MEKIIIINGFHAETFEKEVNTYTKLGYEIVAADCAIEKNRSPMITTKGFVEQSRVRYAAILKKNEEVK